MPRKKDTKTDPAPRDAARRWLVQSVLVVALVAGFLGALIFLGQWALDQIRGQERYAVRFADIEVTPPPDLARAEFLDQVLYYSRFPEKFDILDADLPQKLGDAFAMHPWVEKVDGVQLEPSHRVLVRLHLRQAVLAVPTTEGLIAVDRHGVRLPKGASIDGLQVYDETARPPQGPAGTKWGDAKVEESARLAKKPSDRK